MYGDGFGLFCVKVDEVVKVDQFGDFFVRGWSDVTSPLLTFIHRFIGWKRSSLHIQKIASASYWICRVRSYC